MFCNFTEEVRKVLILSKKEKDNLNSKEISSIHLLLSILSINNDLTRLLKKYNLTYKIIKDTLNKEDNINNNYYPYKKELKNVLERLIIDSKDSDEDITLNNLFLSIINDETDANKILIKLKINIDGINDELNKKKRNKKSILDAIGINLNHKNNNNIYNRDKEINRIIEILNRKNKNNPILVGDAGVGKTSIVEELARRIENKDVPNNLLNKKIIELDVSNLVSGTKYRGDFEEKINKIINEVKLRDDIILFIDEIHTLVGAGSSNDSCLDLSNILKPYLSKGDIRLIGSTTYNEYSNTIEKDKALDRRFQKVIIKEPNKDILKDILLKSKKTYEDYHNVLISEKIIDEIINLSSKYIYDRNEPDRSIDILDEVSSRVSMKEIPIEKEIKDISIEIDKIIKQKNYYLKKKDFKNVINLKEIELNLINKKDLLNIKLINNKKRKVTIEDVKNVISDKSNIPILDDLDINKIKNNLSNKIINQDNAINKLISVTNKLKLGLKPNNKSYSLLFSGNTGVGKTYLAKEYAYNITNNYIKLDMNEYILPESINKLIGAPSAYIGYEKECMLDKVKRNPYSVLILDEIEKCNKSILNFFLNILDEGYAYDNRGNKINFNNVIIIMTTNAKVKKNKLGFISSNKNSFDDFPKEFLNRIDEIIEFNDIDEKSVRKIIKNEINNYNVKNNTNINLSSKEIEEIINLSEYSVFGARKLKRLINKKIYTKILSKLSNSC